MKVRFKQEREGAVLPVRAKEGDAGRDLTAIVIETPRPFYRKHFYGLSVEIPVGYVGLLFPRSSICNHAERLTNCVGVIDSCFRGEVCAVFDIREGLMGDAYKEGDRTAQLVIVPFLDFESEWADTLSETARGANGYGSSGK